MALEAEARGGGVGGRGGVQKASSPSVLTFLLCACVLVSSCKNTSGAGLGPALQTLFNFITSLETLSPNAVM